MLDPEKLRRVIQGRLSPRRYAHSINVQRRAARLAGIHGADWYRAAVAGLVHDICREEPEGWQLKYLRAHDILLDDFTLRHPMVWHAVTGAAYLYHEIGLRDTPVLDAVRFHTTGRGGMSLLEKVVFLADVTSADRDFPGIRELRRLSEEDLNHAMYQCIHREVCRTVDAGKPVIGDSWEALRYFRELLDGERRYGDDLYF